MKKRVRIVKPRRCILFLAWMVVLYPASGSGQPGSIRTGIDFFRQCEPFRQWSEVRAEPVRFNQCAAYTIGVLDTFRLYATFDENTLPLCMPSSVNTYQLLLIILDSMQSRREDLDVDTALIIMSTVRDQFPCDP